MRFMCYFYSHLLGVIHIYMPAREKRIRTERILDTPRFQKLVSCRVVLFSKQNRQFESLLVRTERMDQVDQNILLCRCLSVGYPSSETISVYNVTLSSSGPRH
jgi:hypothetical protein